MPDGFEWSRLIVDPKSLLGRDTDPATAGADIQPAKVRVQITSTLPSHTTRGGKTWWPALVNELVDEPTTYDLVPTDDPSFQPTGWAYVVKVGSTFSRRIDAPAGATRMLGNVLPVPDEPQGQITVINEGGGGSTDIVTVSGAADLPDTDPDGRTTTYHMTSETVLTTAAGTITLAAGWWSLLRDRATPSGWLYWALAAPAAASLDGAVVLTEVTPPMPVATDASGTAGDGVTIPTVAGVIYRDGLVDLAPGFYAKTGSFSITPVATSGYVLVGTPDQWNYNLGSGVVASWATYADMNCAGVADGTNLQGLAATSGTTISAMDQYGNWNGSTAKISGGALQAQVGGNSEAVQYKPLPAPPGETSGRRVTIWYDCTTATPGGYESKVRAGFAWLAIMMVKVGATMTLNDFTMQNVAPPVATVEEGTRTGLPLTGKLTLEVDANGYDVRVLVNDVLKASCNISTNLYEGNPVNIRNEAGTAYVQSAAKVTRTLYEVYS